MSVVLLDCDGVLANFVDHLRAELAKLGHKVSSPSQYDFLRGFGEEVGAAARTLLKDPDTWRLIPPYEEAQKGVEFLRSLNHEIVVVTSPWLSCRGWADTRREWLDKHFDVSHADLIVTSRKEQVHGDVFLDDRSDMVQEWQEKNPTGWALLMNRSWAPDVHVRGKGIERFDWAPGWLTHMHNRLIGAYGEGELR